MALFKYGTDGQQETGGPEKQSTCQGFTCSPAEVA